MTYKEMTKLNDDLLLIYLENGNVHLKSNLEIILITGETIICDLEDIVDTCNDDEEDIVEITITARPETPSWPFEYDPIIIDNNDIKSLRLL